MVVAQKLKQDEITEQDSLLLTRNLLRIAIYNITYIRGLFPEKYFNDKSVPALDMKIKKLMPMDIESRRLIDWMEKGVYDALQKKYLKTLLFCICETLDGPMIEEYAFSFSYSNSDSQEVTMNINRTGSKKQGGFKCDSSEVTPAQMRFSACKMVRTLVQLMRTLDKMPDERTILMKLLYYDEVTPEDYEPPFFKGCNAEEAQNPWTKNPLKMDVGNVNSKHFVLALKVKSVLDPCEDDSDDNQDVEISLGADTMQGDDSSDSEIEAGSSPEKQFPVAQTEKEKSRDKDAAASEDDTQDYEEDEMQLRRMKDWLSSCHLETLETNDLVSNFPDISPVLLKATTEKLIQEGILCKVNDDTYYVKTPKLGCNGQVSDYEFEVKEEINDYLYPARNRTPKSGEDPLYMKGFEASRKEYSASLPTTMLDASVALYHALPMDYVSVPKLQTKLDGEANLAMVKRFIEKMTKEGFIEPTSSRRLGKRVIHSEQTENKLSEVKEALKIDAMDADIHEIQEDRQMFSEMQKKMAGNSNLDGSTCGGLHSVGSDLTRTVAIYNAYQNNSSAKNEQNGLNGDQSNSPTSKGGPVASIESAAPENDKGRNKRASPCGNSEATDMVYTRSMQTRKASMVREPIMQFVKRQKLQQAV